MVRNVVYLDLEEIEIYENSCYVFSTSWGGGQGELNIGQL